MQARQSRGRPEGGQFVAQAHSDGEVILDALDRFFDDYLSNRDEYVALSHRLHLEHPSEIGRTRIVFLLDETVLKIPLTDEGLYANALEADHSRREGKTGSIPIADCAIDWHGDLSVLRMERVDITPSLDGSPKPAWTGAVDCGQVGYDREGRLVAFDL